MVLKNLDPEVLAPYLKKHDVELPKNPNPAALGKKYEELIARLKKQGVKIGSPCARCKAVSLEIEEICPVCGDDLADDPKTAKAMTKATGDKVELAIPVRELIAKIRESAARTTEGAWETGRLLKIARDTHANGDTPWNEWVEKECGLTHVSAWNLIGMVERFPSLDKLPSKLPRDVLYLLKSATDDQVKQIEQKALTAGTSAAREEAKAVAATTKDKKKSAAAKERHAAKKAGAKTAKTVSTARDAPLFSRKIGDKGDAHWTDGAGKRLQTADAMVDGKGSACITLGRNVRLLVTPTNTGVKYEFVA